MESSKVGFIGAGNMATSLINGLLTNGFAANQLWASDIDADKLAQFAAATGINTGSTGDLAAAVDVLVLAVKPQVMHSVCSELKEQLQGSGCLLISIAAGISLQPLQNWLGADQAIVRCMPNTPALVGKGATGLYANDQVSAAQKQLAQRIVSAVGISVWVADEMDIDSITALSGSGPAYFFLLMEAMQDTAITMGLDKDSARQLTYQTALGAAALAMASSDSTEELRRKVTSPGGTTEQGINTFEAGGFRDLVEQALTAARRRSVELAQEFGSE